MLVISWIRLDVLVENNGAELKYIDLVRDILEYFSALKIKAYNI